MNHRLSGLGIVAVALSIISGMLAVPSGASAGAGLAGFAGPARAVTATGSIRNGSQQFTSRNWDGYITYAANEGTDFNSIKATWVQPTVTCETADAWTVFWVGLDGWWNDTVEQGGSSARCHAKGTPPTYALWWEMFPTNAIQTVLTINAGDTITASVTYKAGSSKFTISVDDVTSGQSFTRHARCANGITCERSSADVITEDVGRFGAGDYFPLANYGTMGYSHAAATDIAGQKGSISQKHWLNAAVTEARDGVTYTTVSPLSTHGTAFTTRWQHQ